MTVSFNMKIKGFNRIQKGLTKTEAELSALTSVDALQTATNAFMAVMKTAPPETDRNKPGRIRKVRGKLKRQGYYVRGVGYMSPNGFLQKLSEDLTEAWVVNITKTQKYGAKATFYNIASYYKYVQGAQQTNLMRRIGWKNEDQGLEAAKKVYSGKIEQINL